MLGTLRRLDALSQFLSPVIPERESPTFMPGYYFILIEHVKAVDLRFGGCLSHLFPFVQIVNPQAPILWRRHKLPAIKKFKLSDQPAMPLESDPLRHSQFGDPVQYYFVFEARCGQNFMI